MNVHPGWMLIVLGVVLAGIGLVWTFAPAVSLGRLPGDIRIETGGSRIYIPITTCIVISLLLSAAVWLGRCFSR